MYIPDDFSVVRLTKVIFDQMYDDRRLAKQKNEILALLANIEDAIHTNNAHQFFTSRDKLLSTAKNNRSSKLRLAIERAIAHKL